MFCRLGPFPVRTADESSFTAHESPAPTSNPPDTAAIRFRASTPAPYQVRPGLLGSPTQLCQAVTFISASAWKFGPSARIDAADMGRIWVLSAARGGTLM